MKIKDRIIKYSISLVFILLPLIDIIRGTDLKDIEIFNIALIEFVNIFLISVAFITSIIKNKFDFKKGAILYVIFLGIYLVLHCLHIYNFNTSIYEKANPNFFVELYYIFRVYMLPLMLIITLWKNKDIFNKQYYLGIVKYLVCFISGLIVVSNIFRISYSSYPEGTANYLVNSTNFFDVFIYKDNFRHLFTMGLFPSANQISIILVMLLPINIYNLYTNKKIKNLLLVILQITSMIIVGTKVASIGSLLVVFGSLIIYLFFVFLSKEKFDKKYLLMYLFIAIFSATWFYISPFRHMLSSGVSFSSGVSDQGEKTTEDEKLIYQKLDSDLSDDEFEKLLSDNNGTFKIATVFYELYPIKNDRDFWYNMAKRDKKLNNDYRILKADIIERIEKRNDNKFDSLLGLGYTIDFMDIERDYVYQYYLFGIVGFLLLVGPYIALFMYNFANAFNKYNFRYEYCLCLISSFFGLVLCYFSGHLFGWTSPMLILSLTLCIEREGNKKYES